MAEGLVMFFACIIAALIVILFTCLLFKYNPFWVRYQLEMLEVGDVRWSLLSPKRGNGHIIYVVKEITDKRIISDTYVLKDGKYVLDIENRDLSIASFYRLTDPEPVSKEERL